LNKNCVIYLGAVRDTDQYMRDWSCAYAAALRELGYVVAIIDFTTDGKIFTESLLKALNLNPKPAFILSIHGYAHDLQAGNGQSLYDLYQIPFLALSLDNVTCYPISIKHESRFTFWGLYDKPDLDYAIKYINPNKNYFFAPNAGFSSSAPPTSFHERDYDIMFCGTIFDPEYYKNNWKQFSNPHLDALCESMLEILLPDNRKSPFEAIEEALRCLGILSFNDVGNNFHALVNVVSSYVRGYRRKALLNELAQAGLKIHCFGHKKQLEKLDNPNLIIHDFLYTREYLEVLGRSKIVLNTTPNGKYSVTERQLSAMMNGAAVATDTNDYIEQSFTDNTSIIGFSHKDYKSLADKLSYLLASPQKLEEIARNGEEAAKKNHTVRHRAADLIAVAETGKFLLS